uniref:hypothetical protein n=1 Tax=Flavobacterium sp. TaxID=239 RepID=UPI00404B1FA4
MIVLVFRTSIKSKNDIKLVANYLNNNDAVLTWNVDLDDWENILRIEAKRESLAEQIIQNINNFGFKCEELE